MNCENRATIGLGLGRWAALIACCLSVGMAPNLWGQGAGLSATTGTLDRTLAGAGSTVSFSAQVAPLLNKHCGNCHVRSSKGEFSMASFGRLASAPGVLSPGNPNGSKLVTLIESGEMPPKGDVPAADLATIKKWVEAGAAFDGNDRNASLASMGGDAAGAPGRGSAGPGGGGSSRPPGASGSGDYGSSGYGGGSSRPPGASGSGDYGSSGYGGGSSRPPGGSGSSDPYGMSEEDMYADDYGSSYDEGNYGSGYGGPSGTRRGVQSDAELTYIQNFKSAISDAAWSSIIAPAPPDLAVATGPVLKRDAEQAFAAGNYPLALELFFGHMAAEYPDSLVAVQTVKFSPLLRRPVWNLRLGASMSIRGTTSSPNRDPIRETASGRRVAEAGPAGRGRGRAQSQEDFYGSGQGYGDEMEDYGAGMEDYGNDMEDYGSEMDDYGDEQGYGRGGQRRPSARAEAAAPKRTMLSADAKEAMDKTLGLVAEVIGDEFTKRFRQGDFGPLLIAIEPPPEEDPAPNRNARPSPANPADEPAVPALGPMSADLDQLLAEVPETMPMWIPAVIYLGEGASSNDLLPIAKSNGLDLLIHFDVALKEGRAIQGRSPEVQNISRCRLIHVESGKSIVTSKGMDNREAAQLAAAGRSGEKGYVEDQLASLLAVVDQRVKTTEMPPLTPDVARKRVASLMQGAATPSLRTLAEIRLYQALGLIEDSEVEIAFEIIGGPEAMVILHGPPKEKLAMVRKWALRSQGARVDN